MTTQKRDSSKNAYHELPFLLKPLPGTKAMGRRSATAPPARDAAKDAPPPPSAGFNPYFDLPPDAEGPTRSTPEGDRR